jgi:hypothetical protein
MEMMAAISRSMVFALIVMMSAGCSEPELDGRPCPCAEGYLCCPLDNICVKSASQCSVAPDAGVTDSGVRDAEAQQDANALDAGPTPGPDADATDAVTVADTGVVNSDASEADASDAGVADQGVPADDASVDAGAQPTQQAYQYTGAAQNYIVPPGVFSIEVRAWGGGGGSHLHGVACDNQVYPASGGGAGFVESTIAVTPGETLTVLVAGGGAGTLGGPSALSVSAFGGGGRGSVLADYGAGGGGRSAVRRGGAELLTAGGGGGATVDSCGYALHGGVGGGTSGARGDQQSAGYGGGGGTQSAGGAAGQGGGGCNANLVGPGQAGQAFQGGGAGGAAGGGGGGYFGGGGGGATGCAGAGAGGGGSGFVLQGMLFPGNGVEPGQANHPLIEVGVGRGGEDGLDGGPGLVIIAELP